MTCIITENPRRYKQKRHSIRPAPIRNRTSIQSTLQHRTSSLHHKEKFDQVVEQMNNPETQIQIARNSYKRNSKKKRINQSRSKSPMTPLRTSYVKRPSSATHKHEYTPSNSNLASPFQANNGNASGVVTFSDASHALVSQYHQNRDSEVNPLGVLPSNPSSRLRYTQSYGSPMTSNTDDTNNPHS